MPVIRISDVTMERLKAWAEPLQDTAESALAKALDAAEEGRKLLRRDRSKTAEKAMRVSRGRASSLNKLPQKEFRQPLLELLYEMGGSVRVTDLRPVMKKKMMSALLSGDLERVPPVMRGGGTQRAGSEATWLMKDIYAMTRRGVFGSCRKAG